MAKTDPSETVLREAHGWTPEAVVQQLVSSRGGLSLEEIPVRLARYGRNELPRPKPPGVLALFLRQFLSPLIYILLIAAAISLALEEWTDAGFILAVLLINAIIGTTQEYSAQKSAATLQHLVSTRARVVRAGDAYEIAAEELVPGDIVLLESGSRIPADLRLLESQGLEIDESLLTGESLPANKLATERLPASAPLGDRKNMAFAGTHVIHGRARGIVVATALQTELGRLAQALLGETKTLPPLMARMHRFVFRIGMAVGAFALLLLGTAVLQGSPLEEMFFLAVALAVSAIPEGLPVAITVALTIGMKRMADENVIVRRLVAVESLGSCTMMAVDKTGTLTVNELTVQQLVLPEGVSVGISGEGMTPEGELIYPEGGGADTVRDRSDRIAVSAALCNEGFLAHRNGAWTHHGDTVDVALLVMAHKAGITQIEVSNRYPLLAQIPFEPEHRFAATLHRDDGGSIAHVKGAAEQVLPMCDRMAGPGGPLALDRESLERQMQGLAGSGFRVLAIASGPLELAADAVFSQEHLRGLSFLGFVCMLDPLRGEAKDAISACREAGIEVAMITGDHPETALAIARELGLASRIEDVYSGSELRMAEQEGADALAAVTRTHRVYARIEPQQKLQIVEALIRNGHFVAVTGDGANDAPALRAAHVGVAMGKKGTDVARESAELIITDDNFASLVSGVREGRITYNNIRKVVFLLISTGAAEVVLFLLALFTGIPLPLLAVQLLWLNLVTNGIQDVALAFEPAEGGEMRQRPRPPREPIFNRIMLERVIVSAGVIGILAFLVYLDRLRNGASAEEARSMTLMLMVLFENVHVFNSRSELRSAFRHNPLRNPLLLFGTLAAQGIHIAAIYTPGINRILQLHPITFAQWTELLILALLLLLVMEMHKWWRNRAIQPPPSPLAGQP